jgi:hypothetical protein
MVLVLHFVEWNGLKKMVPTRGPAIKRARGLGRVGIPKPARVRGYHMSFVAR